MKERPEEESSRDLTLRWRGAVSAERLGNEKTAVARDGDATHLSLASIVEILAPLPAVLKNSSNPIPPSQSRLFST